MSLLNVLHKQTRPGINTFLFSQIRECTNKGKLCQLTCCTTCTRPTHQILGTSPLTCHCLQGSCSPSLLGAELPHGQCPCYHLLRQKHIKNSDNSFSPQKSLTLAEATCPLLLQKSQSLAEATRLRTCLLARWRGNFRFLIRNRCLQSIFRCSLLAYLWLQNIALIW